MTEPWTQWVTNMVGLDFESTGVDVFSDRIVTGSLVTIGGPKPVVHEWLVNPGVPIPEGATAVHGITDAMAADGCAPAEALTAITGALRNAMTFGGAAGPGVHPVPIVAFNGAYDLSLMHAECVRHGVKPLDRVVGVIDPYIIDKHVDRFRPGKRQLAVMCATYRVRIDGAHESTADVLATLRIVWRMAQLAQAKPETLREYYADRKHPGELVEAWRALGALTLDELHAAQIGWAAEQAASFRSYLVDRGEYERAAAVDGAWPIRPFRATSGVG